MKMNKQSVVIAGIFIIGVVSFGLAGGMVLTEMFSGYVSPNITIEEDHPNLHWDKKTLWCATEQLTEPTPFTVVSTGTATLYVIFGLAFNQTEVVIDNSPPFTNTYYVTNTSVNCTIYITLVSGMVETAEISFVVDNIPPTFGKGDE